MQFHLLLLVLFMATTVDSDCYTNWSRCTPQTAPANGILWKDCPDYCRQCKGRASGGCERVHKKECSGGFQCQCKGGNVKKSDNWIVMFTCGLGL